MVFWVLLRSHSKPTAAAAGPEETLLQPMPSLLRTYRYRAKFRLKGSMAQVAPNAPPWVGELEPLDETHCMPSTGADFWRREFVLQVMLCGAWISI